MKKHVKLFALFLVLVLCISCKGQKKTDSSKDNIKSETKDISISPRSNERYHNKYEYTDAAGKRLIIQNSFPRGGPYTDPNGKEYFKVIFWTRLINETDNPLELKIHFPVDSFEVPWLPGKYYKVLVPPDTMTIDKEGLYDYGMTGLKSFLDNSLHKPSSLKRIINPKASSGFYVVIVSRINEGSQGALRTALSLKGQDLFYRVSLVKGPPPLSLISEKEINCGSINLKNLMLRK